MYRVTFQEDRPDQPSENKIAVTWNGDRGVIDLDLLRKGFKEEFKQAFISANHAFSQDKSDHRYCLRFNKAGLGFFAEGVINDEGGNKKIKQDKFYEARLKGIADALGEIHQSAQNGQGDFVKSLKFDALELPYSADTHILGYNETLEKIKSNARNIGITEVFIGNKDALEVKEGYKVALTNCADPHAMVGNEGYYGSVDAMIATNCRKSSQNVNVAYNQNFVELSYDPKSSSISETNSHLSGVAIQTTTAVPGYTENRGDLVRRNHELEKSKNKLNGLINKLDWSGLAVIESDKAGERRWKSLGKVDEYGLTRDGKKSIVLDLRRDNSRLGTRFDSYQFYFSDNGEISIAGKKIQKGQTTWTNNLEREGGVIDPVLCKFYIDEASNILKTYEAEETLKKVVEELNVFFPNKNSWSKFGQSLEIGLNRKLQKSYANSDHQLIIEDGGRVVVLDKKQLDENQNFSVVSDSSKRLQVMEGFLEKISKLDSDIVGNKVKNIIKNMGDKNQTTQNSGVSQFPSPNPIPASIGKNNAENKENLNSFWI